MVITAYRGENPHQCLISKSVKKCCEFMHTKYPFNLDAMVIFKELQSNKDKPSPYMKISKLLFKVSNKKKYCPHYLKFRY